MGNFMIPVCCVCGRCAPRWHDAAWEQAGGLQDFCPEHAARLGPFTQYLAPHFMSKPAITLKDSLRIFAYAFAVALAFALPAPWNLFLAILGAFMLGIVAGYKLPR